MIKDVKHFTIQRSRWSRGGSRASLLLGEDGKQCCLGFYMSALGYSNKRILNVVFPSEFATYPKWLTEDRLTVCKNPRHCISEVHYDPESSLLCMNDRGNIFEEDRECSIQHMFAQHGIEVTFTD